MIKDFAAIEQAMRDEFDPLLSVRDIRTILSCSTDMVIKLIRDGDLHAFTLSGMSVRREQVHAGMRGLRITPSSLRTYLDTIAIH